MIEYYAAVKNEAAPDSHTSSQDGGVDKDGPPPHTTTAKTTTGPRIVRKSSYMEVR